MSDRLVREPWWASALSDLLRLLLLAAIVTAVWAAVTLPPPAYPAWVDLPGRVMSALCAEVLMLAGFRLVLPMARPGAHRVGWNADYLRCMTSAAFNDVARLPLLRSPFTFFRFGRVLYFKLLGAEVPWNVSLPEALTVRDPSLLTIGPGVQLESGVVVEAALFGAGRVRIGKVVVGSGSLVGAHTLLMPGAVIAHEARVGPRVLVGEGARVGVGVTVESGVHLQRGADIGSYATVGAGAIVGPEARIGDRARVAAGAFIAPSAEIGEREHWNSAPAQRLT